MEMTLIKAASRPTRRARRTGAVLALMFGAIALTGCGPELGPVFRWLQLPAPQVPETRAPSALQYADNFYVFGSTHIHRVPVTRMPSPATTLTVEEKDALTTEAMPSAPPWAALKEIRGPSVAWVGNRWLMVFGASAPLSMGRTSSCIGRAWSDEPGGPYVAEDTPAACGYAPNNPLEGEANPQLFLDPTTGQNWVIDAYYGSAYPGIYARTVAFDGTFGEPVQILKREFDWENRYIDDPAMVFDPVRGNFLLTYSAKNWSLSGRVIGIARCTTPGGECTKDPDGPWISPSNGRTNPDGLSFFADASGATQGIFTSAAEGEEEHPVGAAASILQLTLEPSVGLGSVVK